MFNTYTDASHTIAHDRRETAYDALIEEKYQAIRKRLSTAAGALQYLLDNEELETCAAMLSAHVRGDVRDAAIAVNRLLDKQAAYEATKAWEVL